MLHKERIPKGIHPRVINGQEKLNRVGSSSSGFLLKSRQSRYNLLPLNFVYTGFDFAAKIQSLIL